MPIVYISPSLQEHNVGFGEYGTEKSRMQLIGDSVVQLLQYNHFEVYRNKWEMTLQQAVADSNGKRAEIHIAIHSDAGNGKARGCTAFYKSIKGSVLAQTVYDYLSPITPAVDRGVKQTNSLYELNNTKAIAALFEVSFHDNPEDSAWIMTHIYNIAEAIAKGICRYFNIEYKNPQDEVRRYLETMDTLQLQKTLNAWKVTDSDGNSLKEDGIMGKKTLSAVAKAKDLLTFILK